MLQEKVKAKLKKAKEHIVENKETYISGAVCLVVGVAVGSHLDKITVSPKSIVIGNNNHIDQSTIINVTRNAHPGKVIFDPSTQTQYPSITTAAKALNVSRAHVRSLIETDALIHLGDAPPHI